MCAPFFLLFYKKKCEIICIITNIYYTFVSNDLQMFALLVCVVDILHIISII